jgi:DHA1 family bicyclomycin/chloramphenicol resistance-like MFS transporter
MIYGPLSDKIGRRKPLLLGLAIYLTASLGCMLATSIEALLIMRFLQALAPVRVWWSAEL